MTDARLWNHIPHHRNRINTRGPPVLWCLFSRIAQSHFYKKRFWQVQEFTHPIYPADAFFQSKPRLAASSNPISQHHKEFNHACIFYRADDYRR